MQIKISMADDVLRRYGNQLGAIGDAKARMALARAVNHTGAKAKTQVIRALTKQTGLKRGTIVKAVRQRQANPTGGGDATYELVTRGGDISLKVFAARELRAGTKAKPWGRWQMFPGAFMRGGRFPKRVPLSMGGHVFRRAGSSRLPIALQKSGVYIPKEMLAGETAAAWERVIATSLMPRVQHEIARLLPK